MKVLTRSDGFMTLKDLAEVKIEKLTKGDPSYRVDADYADYDSTTGIFTIDFNDNGKHHRFSMLASEEGTERKLDITINKGRGQDLIIATNPLAIYAMKLLFDIPAATRPCLALMCDGMTGKHVLSGSCELPDFDIVRVVVNSSFSFAGGALKTNRWTLHGIKWDDDKGEGTYSMSSIATVDEAIRVALKSGWKVVGSCL